MTCNCCDQSIPIEFGEIVKIPPNQNSDASSAGDAQAAIFVREYPDDKGGTVLDISGIDLSNDTVNPNSLIYGYTAHDASGNLITGRAHRGTCGFEVEACFGEVIRVPITDYTKLINKPGINGIVLNGNLSLADLGISNIYYDTTENWEAKGDLISETATFYVYTDAYEKHDEAGNTITVASIKIGDGITPLSELQFISGSDVDPFDFKSHVDNTEIHVTQDDKNYWDKKVSMYVDPDNSERIIFTTGKVPENEPVEPDDEAQIPTRIIEIQQLTDDPNDGYDMTWQQAKEYIHDGSMLFLVKFNDENAIIYQSVSAIFDFNIRKYVLRMTNNINEFDRIVLLADNQTGRLHP